MLRQISVFKMFMVSCLLILAIPFLNQGFAQEDPQQQRQASMMVILQINQGMGPGFEAFLKNDFVPAIKKAGSPVSVSGLRPLANPAFTALSHR